MFPVFPVSRSPIVCHFEPIYLHHPVASLALVLPPLCHVPVLQDWLSVPVQLQQGQIKCLPRYSSSSTHSRWDYTCHMCMLTSLCHHVHADITLSSCACWHHSVIMCMLTSLCHHVHADITLSSCACWHHSVIMCMLTSLCHHVHADITLSSCACWHHSVIMCMLTSLCHHVYADITLSSCACWHHSVIMCMLKSLCHHVHAEITLSSCACWHHSVCHHWFNPMSTLANSPGQWHVYKAMYCDNWSALSWTWNDQHVKFPLGKCSGAWVFLCLEAVCNYSQDVSTGNN